MNEAQKTDYAFPPALISRADLARLMREVESVENELEAQKARAQSQNQEVVYHMPPMSRSLSDFVELNQLELSDDKIRMALKENLRKLKDHAPVVHMTFAVDADSEFLQKLVDWLRKEIHPQTLLSVGLQPNLVGGVYVRTPNHVHDFSIKSYLQTKRDVMLKELESLRGAAHAG